MTTTSVKRLALERELSTALVALRRARVLHDDDDVKLNEDRIDFLLDQMLGLTDD